MCIIIVKPTGAPLPSLDTFQNCWSHNDDGAGYMYADKGEVHGVKGFADAETLHAACAKLPKRHTLVIHFRFATHGPRDKTATHPFPVTPDTTQLTALRWKSPFGVAHNGVIHKFGTDALSDTMEFIQQVLAKPDVLSALRRRAFRRHLAQATSSKYAFMDGSGRCYMSGRFVPAHGCHYSNETYATRWEPFTFQGRGCGSGDVDWTQLYKRGQEGESNTRDALGDWVWSGDGWAREKDTVNKPAPPSGKSECLYDDDFADKFCMYLAGRDRACMTCDMFDYSYENGDYCVLSEEWRERDRERDGAAREAAHTPEGWEVD